MSPMQNVEPGHDAEPQFVRVDGRPVNAPRPTTEPVQQNAEPSAKLPEGTGTAGARLRASLDAALAYASREHGHALEFSEIERLIIDSAADAADRAEVLDQLLDAELAGKADPGVLVRLSAEHRANVKQSLDFVARVNVGPGKAKSERHQRAAGARWNRPSPVG